MTARHFIERAEVIGRELAAAEWDLHVAIAGVEQLEMETIAIVERRDRLRALEADAIKRFEDALAKFFALKRERDEYELADDDGEREAIEVAS